MHMLYKKTIAISIKQDLTYLHSIDILNANHCIIFHTLCVVSLSFTENPGLIIF